MAGVVSVPGLVAMASLNCIFDFYFYRWLFKKCCARCLRKLVRRFTGSDDSQHDHPLGSLMASDGSFMARFADGQSPSWVRLFALAESGDEEVLEMVRELGVEEELRIWQQQTQAGSKRASKTAEREIPTPAVDVTMYATESDDECTEQQIKKMQ